MEEVRITISTKKRNVLICMISEMMEARKFRGATEDSTQLTCLLEEQQKLPYITNRQNINSRRIR